MFTYSESSDAAYLYLVPRIDFGEVDTTVTCDDSGFEINLDVSRERKLLGVEFLNASRIFAKFSLQHAHSNWPAASHLGASGTSYPIIGLRGDDVIVVSFDLTWPPVKLPDREEQRVCSQDEDGRCVSFRVVDGTPAAAGIVRRTPPRIGVVVRVRHGEERFPQFGAGPVSLN